MQNLK